MGEMIMFQLAQLPTVLDQYDDCGDLLAKELEGRAPLELLKEAADVRGADLHSQDYALFASGPDGLVAKYPLHDAGNTLMSAVYWEKTAHLLPAALQKESADKLVQSLDEYGLPVPDYLDVVAKQDAAVFMAKTASFEDVYVEALGEPTADVEELFFNSSPSDRREAALALAPSGGLTEKLASMYAGTELGTDFGWAIDCRIHALPEHFRDGLEDLKKTASVVSPEELVAAVGEIDEMLHITHLYDTEIPDPYRSVFGTTLRDALRHEKVAFFKVAGQEVDAEGLTHFLSANRAQVADTFGDDVAEQLARNPADVLQSLPAPHQAAILRMFHAG